MKKFVVLIVFLGLLSLPLMAQEPKVEVFGGYQYQYLGGDFGGQNTNGWDASVTGYLNNYFGITGDFSGSYKTIDGVSAHLYTYSGGPVLAYREGKVNPFVHVLLGGFDLGGSAGGGSASVNGFTTMFGGGVDYKASRNISIRLADFDWVYYHHNGLSESSNVRLTTGIVFRF
jgi:hypothetical protein